MKFQKGDEVIAGHFMLISLKSSENNYGEASSKNVNAVFCLIEAAFEEKPPSNTSHSFINWIFPS